MASTTAPAQVPLLHDQDSGADHTRSGYRIQVDPEGNATRAIYYMERELANMDPSRPKNYNRSQSPPHPTPTHTTPTHTTPNTDPPPLRTVYDEDEAMSTISSVSQHAHRRGGGGGGGGQGGGGRGGGGYMEARGRARSMDNLDDIDRRYPRHHDDGPRGRRGARAYDHDDGRRRRDYSPEDRGRGGSSDAGRGMQGRRSRSRDDLMDLERSGRTYDDSFLREAMEKKRLGEQQRARSRERLDDARPPPLPVAPPSAYAGRRDDFPPPAPPPYSDDESLTSSKKSNLRKNGAVSRESLVV
ncbi:hypothetical protein CRUP_003927 [Coryphaenoides rupestris]|nr:hypothetical protein CRUP_003927 [Coryphaenoides rupestris]